MGAHPDLYDRSFFLLFSDSVRLALQSQRPHEDPEFPDALGRASLIASLFLLEAAANTCLESLQLERSVHDEIDRLPVSSKFEVFSRLQFRNRRLDRSRREFAVLRELRQLRDAFAHPKSQKVVIDRWTPDESITSSEQTRVLKVNRLHTFWGADDAVKVMRGVHDFLAYFFLHVCKYRPTHTTSLLCSESRHPTTREAIIPYWRRSTKRALEGWRINMSYFKIGWL
jgi:hypothetical protein